MQEKEHRCNGSKRDNDGEIVVDKDYLMYCRSGELSIKNNWRFRVKLSGPVKRVPHTLVRQI